MVELRVIRSLWGIDDPISPTLFQSIKQEGYHGVEVIRLAYLFDPETLIKSLNKADLSLICQIHTCGGFLDDDGDYVYCGSDCVDQHKADFVTQIKECKNLLMKVNEGGFVNVHAGVDAWTLEEAVDFIRFCLKEVKELNSSGEYPIRMTIETHRQRLFCSPFQTRDILKKLEESDPFENSGQLLSELKLNADLSHWYCACERVFDKSKAPDTKWWPEVLEKLSNYCGYIHARFGWSQSPQMADPSSKENESDRALQLEVWEYLINKQLLKDGCGRNVVYMSPEYGPAPYMAVMPHTQEPVASLSDAVKYTKEEVEKLFESIVKK